MELTCVKCGGGMSHGYIVDFTYGGRMQNRWIEGPPDPSFWTGLKISDKTQYLVATYRCVKCGYLESYATEEIEKSSWDAFT